MLPRRLVRDPDAWKRAGAGAASPPIAGALGGIAGAALSWAAAVTGRAIASAAINVARLIRLLLLSFASTRRCEAPFQLPIRRHDDGPFPFAEPGDHLRQIDKRELRIADVAGVYAGVRVRDVMRDRVSQHAAGRVGAAVASQR